MDRKEHIQWCKGRALKYIEIGDVSQALTSMISDMRNHKETENHLSIDFMFKSMMEGNVSRKKAETLINGCN